MSSLFRLRLHERVSKAVLNLRFSAWIPICIFTIDASSFPFLSENEPVRLSGLKLIKLTLCEELNTFDFLQSDSKKCYSQNTHDTSLFETVDYTQHQQQIDTHASRGGRRGSSFWLATMSPHTHLALSILSSPHLALTSHARTRALAPVSGSLARGSPSHASTQQHLELVEAVSSGFERFHAVSSVLMRAAP